MYTLAVSSAANFIYTIMSGPELFYVCLSAHRGATDDFLLLQYSSSVV